MSDHHNEHLLESLKSLQEQTHKSFSDYVKKIYKSKIRSHFPYLFTPTYQGCFIKIDDSYLEDDDSFVDIEQALIIKSNQNQQLLWSITSDRILPFDITRVSYTDNAIEISMKSQHSSTFTFLQDSFSIWLLPEADHIIDGINLIEILKKTSSPMLYSELEDGHSLEQEVKISFGYPYNQHTNHQIRQNLAEPRLQFRININLDRRITRKIKSIQLVLKPKTQNYLPKSDEVLKNFYTNIFPMANQKQMISDSFVMDGHRDIYWLKVDSNSDLNITIHEVLSVYAEQDKLDRSQYKILYKDNQVGIEFNAISNVLGKIIYADIYTSCNVNQSLLRKNSNVITKWFNQSLNTYQLKIKDKIHIDNKYNFDDNIEKTLLLLDISKIYRWGHEEWKLFIKFMDTTALIKIQSLLDHVFIDSNSIKLCFKNVFPTHQVWLDFYISQIESFITNNSHHNVDIEGIFQ